MVRRKKLFDRVFKNSSDINELIKILLIFQKEE